MKWEWCQPGRVLSALWNYIAIIDYLSSKVILRNNILNSYNLRDSENKLAVPFPRTNTIEIASVKAGLFCGTVNIPLM